MSLRARLILGLLLLIPLPASALTLAQAFVIDTISTIASGPEGLAVGLDPLDGEQVIYVSQGDSCTSCRVDIYRQDTATSWVLKRHFFLPSAQGSDTRGLDVLSNGNLLVSSTGASRIYEVVVPTADAATAALASGGINFVASIPSISVQLESVVFADDALYVADEEGVGEAGRIYRFTTSGVLENLPGKAVSNFLFADINGDGLTGTTCPVTEGATPSEACYNDPGGSAYNPFAQRLYFVDDNSGRNRARIFEYDLSGNLISFSDIISTLISSALCTDLLRSPDGECNDPEGLAFARIGGQDYLLVAVEESNLVTAFLIVPEPTTLALIGVASAALVWRRRRGRA
jgi:hypothetical protein